jgi:ABC-type Mn2+/Zn2+ transport system permease subunit
MSEENVLLVIYAITGLLGVPIVNWLKTKFNWSGNGALSIAVAVSFALGLVIAIVNGQITGELVDPAQVGNAFTGVLATATVLFKVMSEGKKE